MNTAGIPCEVCQGPCVGVPMFYSAPEPERCHDIPKHEWGKRIVNNNSLVMIDGREYYIKGRLNFPILNSDRKLSLETWATLSNQNFIDTRDTWTMEGREKMFVPMHERLASNVFNYADFPQINVAIITAPVPMLPLIEVVSPHHPLYGLQKNGLRMEGLHNIAKRYGADNTAGSTTTRRNAVANLYSKVFRNGN